MRILHVGFGFTPWIVNGLVIYCEDLMEGQGQEGNDVGYFFAGRQVPVLERPFLHRWTRGGVRMFEWTNSSLVVGRDRGTSDPGRDLADEPSEAAFRRVLTRFRPEIVHVHDLGGLPSSIIDLAQDRGLPVVMTMHDYHPLCPTIKLFDAHHQICLRRRPGEMCVVCCADAPTDNQDDLTRTLLYERARIRAGVPYLHTALQKPAVQKLADAGIRLVERVSGLDGAQDRPEDGKPAPAESRPRAAAEAYQRRRDDNLDRLNRIDALILHPGRSRDIWRQLGVREDRMHTLKMSPRHIELLRLRRGSDSDGPLHFAVLNGCSNTEKGADLIVSALDALSRRGINHRFRMSIFGSVAPHVRAALLAHPSVELRGEYGHRDLDRLLEDVDVGLMPSVWEEVYGFAGLEFMAKGIPVIGNNRGGIPDYLRPGATGWLNRSGSASEMEKLMTRAIENPAEVESLSDSVARLRDELLCPFRQQVTEVADVYESVANREARNAPHHEASADR